MEAGKVAKIRIADLGEDQSHSPVMYLLQTDRREKSRRLSSFGRLLEGVRYFD